MSHFKKRLQNILKQNNKSHTLLNISLRSAAGFTHEATASQKKMKS